jgi:Bifunctional DNA primase/polymerase, N-terminal
MTAPTLTATAPALAFAERLLGERPLTPTQRAALELYGLGFNIGPARPASKHAYLYGLLRTTRVHPDYLPDLFSDRANIFVMAGRLSMGLYVVDCETMIAAKQHAAEFERRGIRPWTVETARGRHFWLLSPGGEVANLPDDKANPRGWELRGNGCYVLTPPSVHDSGAIYQWLDRPGELPPSVPIDALDWLPLTLALEARCKPEPGEGGPLACLSQATRAFIDHGAHEGSRNRALFSAACDLYGNEFAYSKARGLLSPAAEQAGLSRGEIATTLKSAYGKQRTPAKAHRPAPVMPMWARAVEFAKSHRWQRMASEANGKHYAVMGDTARAVFLACCERARRDNAEVFRASTREVAELAGCKSDTAYRGLICLVGAGLLARRGYSGYGAALYAFGGLLRERDSTLPWSVSSVPILQQSERDVFTRGALGQTAGRAWHVILAEPLRAAELARRLNVHRATVGRALGLLEQHGMAQKEAGRKWGGNSAEPADLEAVAGQCGTLGRADKRQAKHTAERQVRASRAILSRKGSPLGSALASTPKASNGNHG